MDIRKKIIKERTFVDQDGKTKSRWGYRGKERIGWIVVHYTGDRRSQGRAERTANAMQTWRRTASTHYLVGDDAVYQCVAERHAAWHCGMREGVAPKCGGRNRNSLGVDLVEHKRDSSSGSVRDRDWYFSDRVIRDGAALVAMLADRYDIPMDHIVRHYDVTGKACPRPFVGDDTSEITGDHHNVGWIMFKERVRRAREASQ